MAVEEAQRRLKKNKRRLSRAKSRIKKKNRKLQLCVYIYIYELVTGGALRIKRTRSEKDVPAGYIRFYGKFNNPKTASFRCVARLCVCVRPRCLEVSKLNRRPFHRLVVSRPLTAPIPSPSFARRRNSLGRM
jgi:hypothetical protein